MLDVIKYKEYIKESRLSVLIKVGLLSSYPKVCVQIPKEVGSFLALYKTPFKHGLQIKAQETDLRVFCFI